MSHNANFGMIVRMDNSGLGIQTWEAYRHLKPDRVMVVDMSQYRSVSQFPERYPNFFMRVKSMPSKEQVDTFLEGLDAVFTCETPYSFYLLQRARDLGIRTIVQPNYEFAPWMNRPKLPRPDLFVVPSPWHYDEFPDLKTLLPVPIATDRFTVHESSSARKFVHVVGMPAAHDRNGTEAVVKALKFVDSQIAVEIFTQKPGYVDSLLSAGVVPRNVRVQVNGTMPQYYWQMYAAQDVLLLPRRYGGLSLPVNEALGAGIPVVMPDIEPNNLWLPADWLVPTRDSFQFIPGRLANPIEVYDPDPLYLAAKIDQLADDSLFYQRCLKQARILRERYSWQSMHDLYSQTITTMISA